MVIENYDTGQYESYSILTRVGSYWMLLFCIDPFPYDTQLSCETIKRNVSVNENVPGKWF